MCPYPLSDRVEESSFVPTDSSLNLRSQICNFISEHFISSEANYHLIRGRHIESTRKQRAAVVRSGCVVISLARFFPNPVPADRASDNSRTACGRKNMLQKTLFRTVSGRNRFGKLFSGSRKWKHCTKKIFFGTLPAGTGLDKTFPVHFRRNAYRKKLFWYSSGRNRFGKVSSEACFWRQPLFDQWFKQSWHVPA